MHIVKNLKNFLIDQDYYIDIFNDCLHVYRYITLISLSDSLIELKFLDFNLKVKGSNLTILKMDNEELLIKGIINSVEFIR